MASLATLVGHLVDAHRYRQEDNIILSGVDCHTVTIAQTEPFFGYFRYLIATLTDCVLVV